MTPEGQDLAAVIAEMQELGDRLAYQGEDALAIRVVRWADRLALLLAEAPQVPAFHEDPDQFVIPHLLKELNPDCLCAVCAVLRESMEEGFAALPETSAIPQEELGKEHDDEEKTDAR